MNTIQSIINNNKTKNKNFFEEELWIINPHKYGSIRGGGFQILKISTIIIKDFIRDRGHVLASSLTYYSLLALVPTAAIIFSILHKIGIQRTYGADFLNRVIFDAEVAEEIITYVDTARLGALGIIGAVVLLKITVFLLTNVEKAFNTIWGVKESRPLYKKILYYISAIIILPVVITVGLSGAMDFAGDILPFSRGVIPVLITCFGFSFLYFAFPVVKIKMKAALIGGFIAGLLWHMSYRVYIIWSRLAVTELNIIYGSFSQLALVFIWIYIIWLIILIGAEISFAVQNHRIYKREGRPGAVSFSLKEKAGLLVTAIIYINRVKKRPPLTAEEIIKKSGGPIKLINRMLYELTEVGILKEVHQKKIRYFKPAKKDEQVTAWYIIKALNNAGVEKVEFNNKELYSKIENIFKLKNSLLKENFNDVPLAKL